MGQPATARLNLTLALSLSCGRNLGCFHQGKVNQLCCLENLLWLPHQCTVLRLISPYFTTRELCNVGGTRRCYKIIAIDIFASSPELRLVPLRSCSFTLTVSACNTCSTVLCNDRCWLAIDPMPISGVG